MEIRIDAVATGLAIGAGLLAFLACAAIMDDFKARRALLEAADAEHVCHIALERADARLDQWDQWVTASKTHCVGGMGGSSR